MRIPRDVFPPRDLFACDEKEFTTVVKRRVVFLDRNACVFIFMAVYMFDVPGYVI